MICNPDIWSWEKAAERGWLLSDDPLCRDREHLLFLNEKEGQYRTIHVFRTAPRFPAITFVFPELNLSVDVDLISAESVSAFRETLGESLAEHRTPVFPSHRLTLYGRTSRL